MSADVRRRARIAALLAAGLALGGVDCARAACIDQPVVGAARLHEFSTLMMDVSLRCSLVGVPMRPHFEAMTAAHQSLFDAAVNRLQSFFASGGVAADQHGGLYDRYATMVANRYGGGSTSVATCRTFDAIVVELARANDGGRTLAMVAQAMIAHPLLERATCPALVRSGE